MNLKDSKDALLLREAAKQLRSELKMQKEKEDKYKEDLVKKIRKAKQLHMPGYLSD